MYTKRAKVLSNLYDIRPSNLCPDRYFIDCNIEVGWLAKQLFKECPSLIEQSICYKCDYTKVNKLTAILIQDRLYETSKPATFIETFCFNSDVTTCPKCDMEESVSHEIIEIGM